MFTQDIPEGISAGQQPTEGVCKTEVNMDGRRVTTRLHGCSHMGLVTSTNYVLLTPRPTNGVGGSSAETMQFGSDVCAANEDIGSRVRWQDLGGAFVRSSMPKCLCGRVRKSFFKGLRR